MTEEDGKTHMQAAFSGALLMMLIYCKKVVSAG